MGEVLRDSNYLAQLSVIGSMLADDRCVPAVMAGMTAEDFTDGTCRSAYRTIREMKLAGRPIDLVSLADAMSGGEECTRWLREVAYTTPSAANVESYMEIARTGAAKQRGYEYAARIAAAKDIDEMQALFRAGLSSVQMTDRIHCMSAKESAESFLAQLASKEKPEYLPWGVPTLDSLLQVERGDFVLLGGHPSAGKTLLSITMALAQAKRYKVGYYSLETSSKKMCARTFAHLSGVSLKKIKTRDVGPSEWERLAEAANCFVEKSPFDLIDKSRITVDEIMSHAISKGYDVIYIDYVQLIRGAGARRENRYEIVTDISMSLKSAARDNNIAVVALAQLKRAEPVRVNNQKLFLPPDMTSFKESGQLDQDADVALLIWPTDANNNNCPRSLKIAKNKEGERKTITLSFNGATQTMAEIVEEGHSMSAAAQYVDAGKAVKAKNRAEAAKQMKFSELSGSDKDNPFA